ncbi:MAG: Trk system potassium transporter TrkA [Anaerovibrio sp.]|uniref:Trk system potassium transporter TrkA n=1 Tax=Anaerovibrio sp. TaxID=1872532 RepID=UPI0026335272|nr:Trk system potassium transporter TrkA [Anaerovibrio sp.]MDD7677115.1 Trk system potassium transporter TrkA [Anaerovibrio sp.]MDY2603682.1 Trk system potassium transporter TrkA [Anaerovibrio sp.]
MRIVIVGAGKLGYSIAELLSQEEYDIVVIDKEEKQLTNIKENLDVLTIAANGSSPITMDNPDVQGADMLIAVTGSDEVNMVCCILAKKHGIVHTVARIRDMQFMSEAKEYLKANFDIDLMLNPEYITAMEINRILMVPAALNVEDFAEGRVRLFETKVRRKSPLANIPLKDLDIPKSILAAMIFRDHRMIVPHGDDCLMAHDNVYFVGETGAIENFSKNLVRSDARKVSRAVIIGAGRAGRFTARELDKQDVQVKIFDTNRERCRLIAAKLSGASMAINADGTNLELLQSEGVADADVMICLTGDDKLNLLLALMGRHMGVKKTIVKVDRYDYIELMEKVGVDIVLSSRVLAASEVLAFVRRGGIVSVSLLEGAKAEAIEVVVQAGARVSGKKLMDAALPRECLVCGYVRGSDTFVPNGHTVLEPGDRAIIIVKVKHSKNVLKYFQKE